MNCTLFYVYSFLKNLVPIYPVYLLLFQSNGLSLSQISLLLAIWAFPVVLLEIPTGVLADHWNRRNMLVIASVLNAACYALWFFSEGFLLYALGFLFWGVGEAFSSGSKEALLYDSLKKEGFEDSFDRAYGQSEFLSGISTGISLLCGGFLSLHLGMKTVLLLSVATCLLGAYIASRLTEVNLYREQNTAMDRIRLNIGKTLKDGAAFLVFRKENLLLVLISITVAGLSGIIDEYDQLIAGGYGLSLTWIGIWGGFRLFLEAMGSKMAWHFKGLFEKLGVKHQFAIIWFLSLLSSLCLLVSGLTGTLWLMPLYGVFFLVMAACQVLQEDYLQKRIEELGRSTVHSMVSLLFNGYGVVFCGLLALAAPFLRVFDLILATALYALVLLAVFGLAYRKLKKAGALTPDTSGSPS